MSDQELPKEFKVFTAIDILNEQCVRLEKGDYDESTVYNKDPLFVAKRWETQGAKNFHIIDLDGARTGLRGNFAIVEKIIEECDVPVQVGGGIRKADSVKRYLDAGAERVILGSIAVKEAGLVQSLLAEFGGDKIVISLDCRGDKVATEGWLEDSELRAIDVISKYRSYGLKNIIYTDIDRDGMLTGPNTESVEQLLKIVKINTTIAGGVSCIEDIKKVKDLRKAGLPVEGVVVGKALYDNKISTKKLYSDDIYI